MPTSFHEYRVATDSEVELDVVIGDGQPGGSTVYIGEKLLKHTSPTDPNEVVDEEINIRDLAVGRGAEILDRSLVISTDVLDLRDKDQAVVTVTLRGGSPSEETITHRKKDDPFDVVNFITIVHFVA